MKNVFFFKQKNMSFILNQINEIKFDPVEDFLKTNELEIGEEVLGRGTNNTVYKINDKYVYREYLDSI